MATKLKGLSVTSVDLVRAGANQEADILIRKNDNPAEATETPSEPPENIFKRFIAAFRKGASDAKNEAHTRIEKDYATFGTITSRQETQDKLWKYTDALTCSIRSIQDDQNLNETQKQQMMQQSLGEFNAAMVVLIEALSKSVNSDPVVEKSDPGRFDYIYEIEKFNPYHDARGRFTSGSGGSGTGAAPTAGGAAGGEETGGGGGFSNSTTKEFADSVSAARDSVNAKDRWRVTAHTQEELENDYPGAKLHVTAGGSTVAVTKDGDIISVCHADGDSIRGRQLLELGVQNGGTKLDSFSGNHGFYVRCGFEPVSWTPFNEEYAPPGWKEANAKPEPVVFYRYNGTGKPVNITLDDFLANTAPFEGENGYGDAMQYRDSMMEG